jgi:hypothetical protein
MENLIIQFSECEILEISDEFLERVGTAYGANLATAAWCPQTNYNHCERGNL